MSDIGAVRG
jgi:hypothetical protein